MTILPSFQSHLYVDIFSQGSTLNYTHKSVVIPWHCMNQTKPNIAQNESPTHKYLLLIKHNKNNNAGNSSLALLHSLCVHAKPFSTLHLLFSPNYGLPIYIAKVGPACL